ncbi:MAG: ATP-binding response regulator [Candidatus Xenobia bacterium]
MSNPLKVLIVEDNLLNRRLVRDILCHRGHQVLEAGSVPEARACLRESLPDVVLLDIQIPGGGGEMLLAEIRQEPRLASLTVVAVTAFAMSGDRERLLAEGFDAYISKPIETLTFGPEVESLAHARNGVSVPDAAKVQPSPSASTSKRILVVDDNLQNRQVAAGHLNAAGYAVSQAESGEKALAQFSREAPDLVLLDVMMPGLDGFETCRRMRSLKGGQDVAIVFFTALNDVGTHEDALSSGADDFLTKPINRTELLLRVRSLIRVKRLQEELRSGYELIRVQRDALLAAQSRKEELTAFLVHDLKNQLTVIMGNAQFLITDASLPQGSLEIVQDVVDSSESMHRMVLNLLDISRSEDSALFAHWSEVDCAGLIEDLRSAVARRVTQNRHTMEVSLKLETNTIRADRELLRRLLENLIDNAIKYVPTGGTICLEAESISGQVELRVRDDGPGIPETYREKIFEKYGQIDPEGAARRVSRGLGLTFCRLVAEVHGGRIWVEENQPHGSVFCLRLPEAQRAGSQPCDGGRDAAGGR